MAELYEIAFAIESQRRAMARAPNGAVPARQVQARQERRGRREKRVRRQDRHADVLKLPGSQAPEPPARRPPAMPSGLEETKALRPS